MGWVLPVLLLTTAACTELLGLDDLPYGAAGGGGGAGGAGAGESGTGATNGSGGCQADLSSDIDNCGICGRTCTVADNSAGVSCELGNCEQACLDGFLPCQDGCAARSEKCLQPEDTPRAVALDESHVYVALSNATPEIVRFDRDLSNRQQVVAEELQMNLGVLLVHQGVLYWGTVEALRKMPLPDGEVTTLHSGNVFALEADETHLYWADFSDQNVWRMPLAGGPKQQVTQLEASDGIADFAVTYSDVVYSTLAGVVAKASLGGGAATNITGGLQPEARPLVGLSTGKVFWGQSTGIVRYERGQVHDVVPDTELGFLSLAVNDDHLYYYSYDQERVARVTHEGDSSVPLADDEQNVANVTVGRGGVYWTRLNAVVLARDP